MKREPMCARVACLASMAIVLFSVGACASSTALEDALQVTALSPEYQRDSLGIATISYRVSNASGEAVYLATCGGLVAATLDQRVGSSVWIQSQTDIGFCFSSFAAGPYRLEPGASVQAVHTARPVTGVYRLSVSVGASPETVANRRATSGAIRIL